MKGLTSTPAAAALQLMKMLESNSMDVGVELLYSPMLNFKS